MTDELVPEAWTQRRGEGRRAYSAFIAYRGQTGTRSIGRIARRDPRTDPAHNPDALKPIAGRRTLNEWSAQFGWVERVKAWDAHLARIQDREREQRARDAVERHDTIAGRFLSVVESALDDLDGDISDLKPADVVRMFAEAVKVQRISRGEPTEIQQQQGPDGGPIAHRVDVSPKDEEETFARMQGLEELGELPAGTVAALRALSGGAPGPEPAPVAEEVREPHAPETDSEEPEDDAE